MKCICISVFLLLSFFHSKRVFAKNFHFNFEFEDNVSNREGILRGSLQYDLSGEDPTRFIIKPVGTVKNIGIWNAERELWLPTSSFWSNFPYLDPNFLVRLENSVDVLGELGFKIQDTKMGIVYETPTKKFWSHKVWLDYIHRLNGNIADWNGKITE